MLVLAAASASVFVNRQSGIITTVAGNSGGGSVSGDGGPATAASLGQIFGLAVDLSGNIYISVSGNKAGGVPVEC